MSTLKMKSRTLAHFVFLVFAVLLLSQPHADASKIAVSYYRLIQQAFDILIIDVEKKEGLQYAEKAVVRVTQSLKGAIQRNKIEKNHKNNTEKKFTEIHRSRK